MIDAQHGEILDLPTAEFQDVDTSLAIGLSRAEIDMQVLTARKFPRQLTRVAQSILSLATLDDETAEECIYALPRAGKPIQGPSVRFAEIVESCFGNCRSASRVVFVDRHEKVVIAEGIFHDLETNHARRAEIRRRIADKKGRLYSDDMIIVTGNAAASIAMRNAILAGVPRPVWRKAYDLVHKTIAGTIATLSETRAKAVQALAHFGVTPDQIFQAIDVAGLDDIKIEHIPILRGMFAALKNGEATVEEMFSFRTTAERDPNFNPLVRADGDHGEDSQAADIASPQRQTAAHRSAGGDRDTRRDTDDDRLGSEETATAAKTDGPVASDAKMKKSDQAPAQKPSEPPSADTNTKPGTRSRERDRGAAPADTGTEMPGDAAGGEGEAAAAASASPELLEKYSKALFRALQRKTLEKIDEDFRKVNPEIASADVEEKMSRILEVHVRRCAKEIDDSTFDKEIKGIIGL